MLRTFYFRKFKLSESGIPLFTYNRYMYITGIALVKYIVCIYIYIYLISYLLSLYIYMCAYTYTYRKINGEIDR